eukprot:COSAG01_NODE_1169_length_11408_cov_35.108056_2_plen_96_part_00
MPSAAIDFRLPIHQRSNHQPNPHTIVYGVSQSGFISIDQFIIRSARFLQRRQVRTGAEGSLPHCSQKEEEARPPPSGPPPPRPISLARGALCAAR